MMELRINIVEAAAEIAETLTSAAFDDINDVFTKDGNGDTVYTDKAQNIFNAEYDDIFTKLIDAKSQELPDAQSKMINIQGLADKLSHEEVERTFNRIYEDCSKGVISDMIWELGELDNLVYTPDAQKVFDGAKDKYLMHLMEFEV
jgi:hypothetical protein